MKKFPGFKTNFQKNLKIKKFLVIWGPIIFKYDIK